MTDSDIVKRLLAISQEQDVTTGESLLAYGRTLPLHEAEMSAREDLDTIELGGRLNWSPRENWIEKVSTTGLPDYIETVAIGIMKGTGYPRERAIPIAISRIKRWAAGLDGAKADTIAKSAKALAEWEKLKAKAAARRARKG